MNRISEKGYEILKCAQICLRVCNSVKGNYNNANSEKGKHLTEMSVYRFRGLVYDHYRGAWNYPGRSGTDYILIRRQEKVM